MMFSIAVQGNLQKARILRSSKHTFSILDNVSGTLSPVSPFSVPQRTPVFTSGLKPGFELITLPVLPDFHAVQCASVQLCPL